MVHWMERRYKDALRALLEPSLFNLRSLWIYHNLVGMVARQIEGESERAFAAFERSISL